jgi:hypothetical protein
MKLDLLTNATVVDDAMKFVSSKSKDIREKSNEPDGKGAVYNSYSDTATTVNHVF